MLNHFYLLVEVLNSSKGLQCVTKDLLGSSSLSVISKCSGTKLNHTTFYMNRVTQTVRIKM